MRIFLGSVTGIYPSKSWHFRIFNLSHLLNRSLILEIGEGIRLIERFVVVYLSLKGHSLLRSRGFHGSCVSQDRFLLLKLLLLLSLVLLNDLKIEWLLFDLFF